MSFQSISNEMVSVNGDLKIETLSVRISKITGANGEALLVAHHPRNANLNLYSGSQYQVNWYTGRGEPIAESTITIPYSCGINVIAVVQKRYSPLSGGDHYQAAPCKSGFEPVGPVYQYPDQ